MITLKSKVGGRTSSKTPSINWIALFHYIINKYLKNINKRIIFKDKPLYNIKWI